MGATLIKSGVPSIYNEDPYDLYFQHLIQDNNDNFIFISYIPKVITSGFMSMLSKINKMVQKKQD